MTRRRATVLGFGCFTGFGSGGLPKVRCGFTSPSIAGAPLAETGISH
jgi:hypothetical protein